MTTLAPCRANASAAARPMPLAPPVTNATLPAKRCPVFSISLFLLVLCAQQRFDRATLVHRAIALGDLIERQHEIEHSSRVDFPREDQIDQLRQITTNGRRTAEQTDVPEEEIRAVERDAVRHADVADRTARPR